jgi:hypothetical protein|tara:strand:- start:1337 stop:1684 length:348 start_codon:yes stop_codon:yes gene_type:complete
MAKSTKTFKQYFNENITTSDAGIGSTNVSGEPMQGDFYAPNDSRVPKILGKVATRKGTVGKKEKDDKKRGINGIFLNGEDAEEEMCPEACCGMPVKECKCGPDCEHCDCYEINNG